MSKLTKRVIEAAQPGAKELCIWDGALPGFGLRVMPSGRKSYVVQYRAGRRSRRITLGPTSIITPDQARTRAIAILSEVRAGKDPAADRDAGRTAMLVIELAQRFDDQHIAIRIKESPRIPPQPSSVHPARHWSHEIDRGHAGRHCEVPSRPSAHPLSSKPLSGDNLQDVQSCRGLGPESGRQQS